MMTTPLESTAPASSPRLTKEGIERALSRLSGSPAELLEIAKLSGDRGGDEIDHKQIGYGDPLLLRYRAAGQEWRAVLHTMAPNWFGHDRRSDRAALTLLAAEDYARVPDHVEALDVGAVGPRGELISLREAGEFYLLTTYAEGKLYAGDLRRIERTGEATELDVARARALAAWLARLHERVRGAQPELYHRAIRDLIGSGEGIFGISDSYPEGGPVPPARLAAIEARCVRFRWALRGRAHRLARTHGDFHPYNVLFREGTDFTLLDASRGGVGDPADDLAAMTINHVFGGIVYPASWSSGLRPLWDAFWSTYLERTDDEEVLEVIAPFFAWRALVVASPVWYPDVPAEARSALLSFAESALDAERFDLGSVDRLLGARRESE